MLPSKKNFIEFMMGADVLRFGEFKTKSGRLSPYFVNTGNYRTGAQIAALGGFYAEMIYDTLGDSFDAMFGPAYKGIPLVTAAAAALYQKYGIDKPYFFNRKEAKDHGEGGAIVGYTPKAGDRIIIIEDVITAGTAVRETMPILKQWPDVTVEHMFISVNRMEIGSNEKTTAVMEVKKEFGIEVHSIITVSDVREYLKETENYDEILKNMEQYMTKYCIL